ncbi:MAG: hypothetical protein AAF740_04115, partial [Bacteroidota bacterium]
QLRTESGEVRTLQLEDPEDGDAGYFMTDLQLIKIKGKSHYLILGWGTSCGGKQGQSAKLYVIKGSELVKVSNTFGDNSSLHISANRSQEINLEYDSALKTLSYREYERDEGSGFFKDEYRTVKWKLGKEGFERLD